MLYKLVKAISLIQLSLRLYHNSHNLSDNCQMMRRKHMCDQSYSASFNTFVTFSLQEDILPRFNNFFNFKTYFEDSKTTKSGMTPQEIMSSRSWSSYPMFVRRVSAWLRTVSQVVDKSPIIGSNPPLFIIFLSKIVKEELWPRPI